MNEKRHQIHDLLGAFDDHLRALALKYDLTFNTKAGPGLGRELRRKEHEIERGVFLELDEERWYDADPTNPKVIIAYCAWLRPTGKDYPLYFFSQRLFEGKWLDLPPDADILFTKAAGGVVNLTREEIMSKGQYFERMPSTG